MKVGELLPQRSLSGCREQVLSCTSIPLLREEILVKENTQYSAKLISLIKMAAKSCRCACVLVTVYFRYKFDLETVSI